MFIFIFLSHIYLKKKIHLSYFSIYYVLYYLLLFIMIILIASSPLLVGSVAAGGGVCAVALCMVGGGCGRVCAIWWRSRCDCNRTDFVAGSCRLCCGFFLIMCGAVVRTPFFAVTDPTNSEVNKC